MRLVFVLTNYFTKTDPPNGYRLFLLPSIPFPNMRALDRAGYELNTIGSFEVCPTNNWRRMLERKGQFVEGEKSGIIDFFSLLSFPLSVVFIHFFKCQKAFVQTGCLNKWELAGQGCLW